MEFVNFLQKIAPDSGLSSAFKESLKILATLLVPLVPHFAEEIGQALGMKEVSHQPWPSFDLGLLAQQKMVVVVQVNGKLRTQLQVEPDISEEEVAKAARLDSRVAGYLEGKEIKKSIYVKGKLVNFVVG